MENNYLKEQQYLRAKKRVKDIKGFYSHLTVYIIINIFLSSVIVFGLTKDGSNPLKALTNFGVYSTWLFWGIGVFFHWFGVFGFKNFFGKSWEDKKIKELMEADKRRTDKYIKK